MKKALLAWWDGRSEILCKIYEIESYGGLHDFALDKLKGIVDELIIIFKTSIKEVVACALSKLNVTMCFIDLCWLNVNV